MTRAVALLFAALLFAVLTLVSCSRGVNVVVDDPFPKKLSAWRLFTGELRQRTPAPGVMPYDLNTPLFSDYAGKSRLVWMPQGAAARYNESEAFEFPQSTVIAKTFSFGDRAIETRLLVNTSNGWRPLVYVWNAEQTEALFELAPDPVPIKHNGLAFTYYIPNLNQCKACHDRAKRIVPIGPAARHLNKDYNYAGVVENQLVHWTNAGYLTGAPAPDRAPRNAVWDQPATGTLERRARAYLDANCGHCHNPEGAANTSGLFLTAAQVDPLRLGFCKVPVAAGHGSGDLSFDMVHGHPEESILVRRMDSVEPKVMMPEIGRSTIHKEGVELIRDWVASVHGDCK